MVEATAYKLLQSQFSLAVAESGQLRAILEENKLLLNSAKEKHFTQLEKIREEELKYQLEVSEEMAQLQRALEASKREGELLRVEFERTLASNEQAAPIAKELQVTVASLQKTIQQLKSELTRCKSRSSSSSSGSHKAEQSSTKVHTCTTQGISNGGNNVLKAFVRNCLAELHQTLCAGSR